MLADREDAPNIAPLQERVPEVLIHIAGLRVRYGERWALQGLSFEVRAGEVVGLLGPNGAGKTTTLSVLATLLPPQAGTLMVAGHSVTQEPARVRRALGIVPQSLALYPTFTARENALLFAQLVGLRGKRARAAAEQVLRRVGLDERAHELVGTFSGGMQRRLNLACGILHAPRVLLLDEPTVGVDPQSRERIIDAVREQAAGGAAVLYSTHYLEEAERVCDRVVLIDEGCVVTQGTPEQLIRQSGGALRLEVVTRSELPADWFKDLAGVSVLGAAAQTATATSRGVAVQLALHDLSLAAPVLERAAQRGNGVLEFHVHHPGLQDVFIALTGRELRD
jgi:ABC-2 type transport system ATP-binding protein